jgi:hypothetical protein
MTARVLLLFALQTGLSGCLESTTRDLSTDSGLAFDDAGAALDPDAGTTLPDAGAEVSPDAGGDPLPDAGPIESGTVCDVSDLQFEGTWADIEPTTDTGRLRIHFGTYSTGLTSGPCDALGGAAWPEGWWGQGVRHGRASVLQSRQNGSAICAAVVTAAHDLVYEGTIAADCASMSGTFTGTMDDGTLHRGTWTATRAP